MPEIRCSVQNCHYWGKGNFCQADSIIIQNDRADRDSNLEQYVEHSILSGDLHDVASTSNDTCCKTFVPRK